MKGYSKDTVDFFLDIIEKKGDCFFCCRIDCPIWYSCNKWNVDKKKHLTPQDVRELKLKKIKEMLI